jgi:hypothetical protein
VRRWYLLVHITDRVLKYWTALDEHKSVDEKSDVCEVKAATNLFSMLVLYFGAFCHLAEFFFLLRQAS